MVGDSIPATRVPVIARLSVRAAHPRPQCSRWSACGLSRLKPGVGTSNSSPLSTATMWKMPDMNPEGVSSGVPEVYSNVSPGSSTGCSPTTPGP